MRSVSRAVVRFATLSLSLIFRFALSAVDRVLTRGIKDMTFAGAAWQAAVGMKATRGNLVPNIVTAAQLALKHELASHAGPSMTKNTSLGAQYVRSVWLAGAQHVAHQMRLSPQFAIYVVVQVHQVFVGVVWQAVLDRKVTRDNLIRHTAVVANPVVGIAHAPAAGNSMMRSSLLGVPVVLCELLVGAPCASLQSALSCCCALLAMTEAQRGELMSSSFVGSARLVKMRCYDSDCLNG